MNLRQVNLKNCGKQLMQQLHQEWVGRCGSSYKENGFFNHSANEVTKTGPMYCFWEVKEDILAEEFQEFIEGSSVSSFGQDALMNICIPIDTSLINGQTPYPSVFS